MPARSIPRSDPQAASRSTLLYLETDGDSIALAGALLAGRTDVALLHASDLGLLIKHARRQRPEMVLINAELADLPPRDLVKRLRAEPSLQDALILTLGADAAPAAAKQSLEAGVFAYLVKPLQAAALKEALDFALEFAAAERAEQL